MNSTVFQTSATVIQLLESWVKRKWLREIDLAFAQFLEDEVPNSGPMLLLAAALASHQLGRGHVCLDLNSTLADPFMVLSLPPETDDGLETEAVPLPDDILKGISLEQWCEQLNNPLLVSDGSGSTPLVLSGHRIYLRRYWQYERNVEAAIQHRLSSNDQISQALPEADLQILLADLFPTLDTHESSVQTDWQKIACALAARSAFSIITGGPGTGKTTTVVKLLALLQSLAIKDHDQNRPLRIQLAAPTGKAAARLKESISGAIDKLPCSLFALPGLRDAIPTEVITLHRLLGTRPNSRQFRHNARNPLALDVLVVDEASMVDLEMMAAMLSALPAQARLVILGDKDQLASVEAGSVLGELCKRAREGHFDKRTQEWIERITQEKIDVSLIDPEGSALDQCIVMLRRSHRFTASSGIGQLAEAVNSGESNRIEQVWQHGYVDLLKHDLKAINDAEFDAIILGSASKQDDVGERKGYAHYLSVMTREEPPIVASATDFDGWARQVLAAHSQFQILSALRNGPYGVTGLNQRIFESLAKHKLIASSLPWYQGRPVLVTRNDYRLGLMNGDIGITLRYPRVDKQSGDLSWVTRVAFPKSDGSNGIHWVLPSRLQATETVFALTVHKSQGSEFEHCALILPPFRNPVLTRELVYTGITRAKKWFSLVNLGNPKMIIEAAAQRVQRAGGLFVSEKC